jgi:dUTP pyrophosphatase
MNINVKLLDEKAKLPTKATDGSSGYDIYSTVGKKLLPGRFYSFDTGISLELEPGFEAQVRPRSGLAAKHGITVLNSPGTIDSDYRGEIKVILINHSDEPYTIEIGDRIAQLVFANIISTNLELKNLLNTTERGTNGFGSTGVK